MENVKVTVWLSTYNQEPYVAQALDSILMQKTDFPFEIVVADDCSKDRTQEIILDYQKRYPGKIVTYFTPENVGGCRKLTGCIDAGLFRGEYLSYLEGDDYWLGEDRLQVLVDFLDAHPEYSRVSHDRKIIDENGYLLGYDTAKDTFGRPFFIEDFLAGKNYADYGSVFRNYFREAGGKYHPLFLSSRNVIDFEDMFITQDFGPVYVMGRCFGVYRSRSFAGGTNYNSITTVSQRSADHINICNAVQEFYEDRYDLTPMIRRQQQRLFEQAVANCDRTGLEALRDCADAETIRAFVPEQLYLAWRGKHKDRLRFLSKELLREERRGLGSRFAKYFAERMHRKYWGLQPSQPVRGFLNQPDIVEAHRHFLEGSPLQSIAFVIPYFGKLPNYFPAWLATCAQNPTVDFFVFTDDPTPYHYPDNVRMIPMQFEEAKALLQKHFDFPIVLDRPYKLCDYKPVYGAAFQQWLSDYDFWGHCDIDLIWGNIRSFYTEERLATYDRVLWQGHCSIYRNNEAMRFAFRTLDPKGCMDWRMVYSTDRIMAFDEVAEHNGGGMSLIMERNNIPVFKDWVFADLCVGLNRFQCVFTDNAYYSTDEDSRGIFLERNLDGLYLVYRKQGRIQKQEVMYAHFQKRPMSVRCEFRYDGSDRCLMLPPGQIVAYPERFTEEFMAKTMRKNSARVLRLEALQRQRTYQLAAKVMNKVKRRIR